MSDRKSVAAVARGEQPLACIFCGRKLEEIHRHYHPPVPGWTLSVCVCRNCPTSAAENAFLGGCGGPELLRNMRQALERLIRIEEQEAN